MITAHDLLSLLDEIREHATIAVIHASDPEGAEGSVVPTHNPRGYKSYSAVAEDLQATLLRLGFRDVVSITEGRDLARHLSEADVDLAWPVSAGLQGYDSICHASALLEALGIAYIGHRPGTAALLDDKYVSKAMLASLGVPTAPAVLWEPSGPRMRAIDGRGFDEVFAEHDGAFVIKPVTGRASRGVRMIESAEQLDDALAEAWAQTRQPQLVESYLPGREFCVGCLGRARWRDGRPLVDEQPLAFAHLERRFLPGETIFTSMDVMPISGERVRLLGEGERLLQERIGAIARRVYEGLMLRAVVRLDLRQDAQGRLQVLEVNPKPDLRAPNPSGASLLALGAAHQGMSYDDMILSLVVDFLHRVLSSPPPIHRSLWRALGRCV